MVFKSFKNSLQQTTAKGSDTAHALHRGKRHYPQAHRALLLGALISLSTLVPQANAAAEDTKPAYAIVLHGGAGTITPDRLTPELEQSIKADLSEALAKGEAVLKSGGAAIDAVTAALTVLENSPHFNAGRGAVYTSEGTHSLDSSIMTGHDRNAGAIAGVSTVKNPILLARKVLEVSEHVLLSGEGAEAFARTQGIEFAPESYFHTPYRWEQLQKARAAEGLPPLPEPTGSATAALEEATSEEAKIFKFGTVGAAVLDMHGNLAAGTSTGGTTNKKFGRIGDSPIIGAGTYADNKSCAVSATGHGEYFIRAAVASSICLRVELKGESLSDAARYVIQEDLKALGGDGGIVAVDSTGHIVMEFNTAGMYRAGVVAGQKPVIAIYSKDSD